MAIVQMIFTVLLRQTGKLLNTVFGWATTLLFGKLPEDRQLYLSITALGSVLWIVVALGVAFPRLAAFLLAFVPMSAHFDPMWVRLGMLAAVVLVPLGVGFVSLYLVPPAQRPQGKDRIKAVFKGYPYTLGLALTLILVCLITPFMKLQDLIRRWSATHIPVVIDAKDYLEVVRSVQRALRAGGLETAHEQAGWMMRLPTRIFSVLGAGPAATLIANEMAVLRSADFEVLLHPSDLVIRGKEKDVVRARALLAEHLVFTPAHLTWTKEANELEDRITQIWQQAHKSSDEACGGAVLDQLAALGRDVQKIALSYEEWEVLLRERLLLEQALLRRALGMDTTSASSGIKQKEPQPAA